MSDFYEILSVIPYWILAFATFLFLMFFTTRPRHLIAISGLSGSGKTTVGKMIVDVYGGKIIDLDSYFIPKDKLPKVQLSNKTIVQNYDCYDAINWGRFWSDVRDALRKHELVIIVGFCLPITEQQALETGMNDLDYDYHFHLELDKETSKKRRIISKGWTDNAEKIKRNSLEVDEVVWPFYEQNYYCENKLNYQYLDEVIDATLSPDDVFNHITGIMFSLGFIKELVN